MTAKQPHVIVAGVGSGLGHALAQRFARGYKVAMIARNASKLVEFTKQDPDHLESVACDITDAKDVGRAIEAVSMRFGTPECAIINASARPVASPVDGSPRGPEAEPTSRRGRACQLRHWRRSR